MSHAAYLAKHHSTLFFRRILRRLLRNDNCFFAVQHFFKLFTWSLGLGGRASARPLPPAYSSFKFRKPLFVSVEESELRDWIAKLDFNSLKPPRVSIIIPIYNNPKLLMECIVSLSSNREDDYPFELIIADDCSPDERIRAFAEIEGLKYIRNKRNLGYIKNCNEAFTHASARVVVFLNSDVVVFKKWLSPLVKALVSDDAIGAVGPMLLNSDGSIQESGAMLDNELRPNRLGSMEYPQDPSHNVPMKVDYCSGACLATKKEIFNAVGGFSEYLEKAYWDDVDYGLKLRKEGFAVWRIPESKVIHHENATYSLLHHNNLIEKNYKKISEIWLGTNL